MRDSIWFTLLARIWWRKRDASPPLPLEASEWSRRFATAAHAGLYALMLITPIVGAVTL